MECFRRRRAQLIHPHLSVKASRVHNERVTVPFTGGITEPRWRRVLSQLPAVEVNLPPKTEGLMNNDDVVAHLNNLPWPGRCRNSRHTLRQAVRGRLFSRKGSRFALLESRLCPRLQRKFALQVHGDVGNLLTVWIQDP